MPVVSVGARRRRREVQMVAFAQAWVAHGGGPAELIVERFAMSVPQFFRTVLTLLDHPAPTVQLSPVVVERMRAVARRRIWLGH